jgi:hypothetical protein
LKDELPVTVDFQGAVLVTAVRFEPIRAAVAQSIAGG